MMNLVLHAEATQLDNLLSDGEPGFVGSFPLNVFSPSEEGCVDID